ncbi:tumor necrosis factor receptor superfamily member 6 isoform X2 [Crotalus tigris]|uniref:tumor necrosis factor receptor superfamily member 6 isoform X2 n=1 Tax=Crotalus tigris TaxID=88082 RepID=UPI00192F72E7|nr:tumor necrosis factor receptor superfamily member 6 isoform X2 [Crotalus tigris]
MFELLLFLIICSILDLTAARSLHNSGSILIAQPMHTNQNCPSGQYEINGICCDLCKPGSVAKSLDCTKNPKTNCKPCTGGKEYMDKDNFKTACLRCNFCDTEHGMETEKNCTITQNVICRCRTGFFCESTKPCRHCDKCDKCENGRIEKPCTPTQNTICGEKENLLWLLLILLLVAVIVGLILWRRYCPGCKIQRRPNIPVQKSPNCETYDFKKIEYRDINLKPYIPKIVCDMEVNQVRSLARKLGLSTAQIDRIIHDNLNDSSEQKIKLLECWHEMQGIKDSYQTLITSLKELKFYDTASKVKQLMERQFNHPED